MWLPTMGDDDVFCWVHSDDSAPSSINKLVKLVFTTFDQRAASRQQDDLEEFVSFV